MTDDVAVIRPLFDAVDVIHDPPGPAAMVDAAKKLAGRARRKVHVCADEPVGDPGRLGRLAVSVIDRSPS